MATKWLKIDVSIADPPKFGQFLAWNLWPWKLTGTHYMPKFTQEAAYIMIHQSEIFDICYYVFTIRSINIYYKPVDFD